MKYIWYVAFNSEARGWCGCVHPFSSPMTISGWTGSDICLMIPKFTYGSDDDDGPI